MQIVRELMGGKSYKAIAKTLSKSRDATVSPKTVESHIRNVMKKTGKNAKSELLDFLRANGIFADQTDFRRKIIIDAASKILGAL